MDLRFSHTRNGVGYKYLNISPPWQESGIPVLFQHGIGSNHEAWSKWWPAALSRRPIINVDLRGHGISRDASMEGLTVERIGQDILDVLDELDIPSVHYVGVSAGGMLGLYLAATSPEKIVTVTACSAPFRGDWVNGLGGWEELFRQGAMEQWSRELMDGFFTAAFQKDEPQLIEWLDKVHQSIPPTHLWNLFEAIIRKDLTPILPDIKCPVLNVTSKSPFVDPKNPQQLRNYIAQLEQIVIPDARHGVPISHWKEVSDASLAFMTRWEEHAAKSN